MKKTELVRYLFTPMLIILILASVSAVTEYWVDVPSQVTAGTAFDIDYICNSWPGVTPGDGCKIICSSPLTADYELIVNDVDTSIYQVSATFLQSGNYTCEIYKVENGYNDLVLPAEHSDTTTCDPAPGGLDTATINTRFSALETDIAAIQIDISNLSSQDTVLQLQIDDIIIRVTNLETAVSQLQADLTALNLDHQAQIDSLNTNLATLQADLAAWNHGTIGLVWDSTESRLRVKGTAARGATTVKIRVYDKDDIEIPAFARTVSPGTTDLYYTYDYNTSEWNAQVYNIKASFIDAGNNQIDRWVTEIFTALAIEDLQARAATLESDVATLQSDMTTLEGQVAANNSSIAGLQSDVATLQTKISTAEANIASLQNEVLALKLVDSGLQAQIDALDLRVTELETDVLSLELRLQAMTHGTFNLALNTAVQEIMVFGEMPEGTDHIEIMIMDSTWIPTPYFSYPPLLKPGNEYEVFLDISGWVPDNYTIMVYFYDASHNEIGFVGGMFDSILTIWLEQRISIAEADIDQLELDLAALDARVTANEGLLAEHESRLNDINARLIVAEADIVVLYGEVAALHAKDANLESQINALNTRLIYLEETRIPALEARMTAVEDMLARMNHGTINLKFRSDTFQLIIRGEAPEGTATAVIEIRDLGNNLLYSFNATPDADNEYTYTTDVSNWTEQTYNVRAKFRDARYSLISTAGEAFIMPHYGFSNITTSNRVETYFVHYANVPIDYCVKVPKSGLYGIFLSDGDSFREYVRETSLTENELYCFNDFVLFEETGSWEFYLEIWEYEGAKLYEHYPISIEIIDLTDYIDDSTIVVTLPTPNVTGTPDVYWTQTGTVLTHAILGENTPAEDHYCDVFYQSNEQQGVTEYLARLTVYSAEGPNYCNGSFRTNLIDNGTEGVFRIGVEAEFEAGLDAVDYFYIGVDDTAPIISEIVDPGLIQGTDNILQSMVTDPDSGVSQVWISIQDKDTLVLKWTGEAFLNTATGYYEVNFDSTQEDPSILDGPYNLHIKAQDIAGNEVTGFIDPIVDNTPPAILDWFMQPEKPARGETLEFLAHVTDVFARTETVTVTITSPSDQNYEASMPAIWGDGWDGNYFGTISTDNNFQPGTYTATIKATDFAGNTAWTSAEFELGNGTTTENSQGGSIIVWPETGTIVNPVYNDENKYYNFWVQGGTQQWVKVFMNNEWISLDLNIDNNTDMKALPDQNIIVAVQEAAITSFSWDGDSLHITADGEGEQEVTVYINGRNQPYEILFDGATITNWVFDNIKKTITFTVSLGSPHTIELDWEEPVAPTPAENNTPSGGGGGAAPKATPTPEENQEPEETDEPEEIDLCAEVNCDDANPCTADSCNAGECVFTPSNGIACGEEGKCYNGDCREPAITPEPVEPEPTPEEEEEEPVNPTGFFGMGNMAEAVGGLLVIVIIVGAAFYIKARA